MKAEEKKEIKVKLQLKFKNGKELTLGEEEAKELYDKLDDLFGQKTEYHPYYPVIWYDCGWRKNPYYVNTPPNTGDYWKVTCGDSTSCTITSGAKNNTFTNITYSCNLSAGG